jgi:RNA polymerase primary sigma factor
MTPHRRRNPGKTAFRSERASSIDTYITEIRRYPRLSLEEEAELAKGVQDGRPEALDRLVECNLRFVVVIAREYRNLGLPLEDLVSEGNLGLIEAARRFDPDRGAKFISWAVWWIRKAIRTALSEQAHVVRLPISQVRKMKVVRATEQALREELGREPTLSEMSEKLPTRLSQMDPIHCHGIRFSRLDKPVATAAGDGDNAVLEDKEQATIEEQMLDREALEIIDTLCDQLDRKHRIVLSCRFGLDGAPPMTLAETGRRIGRSREGVRIIEGQALAELRRLFDSKRRPCRGPLRATHAGRGAKPAAAERYSPPDAA